jgi:DNA-binding MarR family transcriptional regulator
MDPAGRERLYHLLQTAAHRLKVRADRDMQGAGGVTAAQAAVMFVIAREPDGTTQKRVADQLKLNESAVTGMVGRLLDAGLVSRAPSPTDGRAWTVALTAEGAAALERFRLHLDALNTELTRALGGEAEVVRFAQQLRAILDLSGP